ncbi:hypothetical protein ACFFHH_22695 [Cytobacillus solani]|nr:hypothetical protein [Cytobacillus solani]
MNIGLIDFENNGLDLYVRVVNLENDKDTLIRFRKDTEINNVGTSDNFDFNAY